jgi:hypothetical protein
MTARAAPRFKARAPPPGCAAAESAKARPTRPRAQAVWRQKNEAKPRGDEHTTIAAVRSELADLNARLDTLQKRFARPS